MGFKWIEDISRNSSMLNLSPVEVNKLICIFPWKVFAIESGNHCQLLEIEYSCLIFEFKSNNVFLSWMPMNFLHISLDILNIEHFEDGMRSCFNQHYAVAFKNNKDIFGVMRMNSDYFKWIAKISRDYPSYLKTLRILIKLKECNFVLLSFIHREGLSRRAIEDIIRFTFKFEFEELFQIISLFSFKIRLTRFRIRNSFNDINGSLYWICYLFIELVLGFYLQLFNFLNYFAMMRANQIKRYLTLMQIILN